jgi:hypothetical protein
MISIEGMNLNVDDWHGRPPAWFDQLSAIVTGLHRVMSAVTGGARQYAGDDFCDRRTIRPRHECSLPKSCSSLGLANVATCRPTAIAEGQRFRSA